jgi:hypothetical protein
VLSWLQQLYVITTWCRAFSGEFHYQQQIWQAYEGGFAAQAAILYLLN